MTHKVAATYDGETVHPDEPLHLAPNSRFEMSYEPVEEKNPGKPASFFETARSMQFEGPPDLSERADHYLYGGRVDEEE